MLEAALLLGRRAAGRETVDLDVAAGEDDYRVGLVLLELLTVSTKLSPDEKTTLKGYSALFQRRIEAVGGGSEP
jgi:hypothetical protein